MAMARFAVTKTDVAQDDVDLEKVTLRSTDAKQHDENIAMHRTSGKIEDLYQEEEGLFATLMRQVTLYNPHTTVPDGNDTLTDNNTKTKKKKGSRGGKPHGKMGTFFGVFLPCIQNIFGVLFFIRLSWIVGTAGILEGFWIVFICCSVTFLTSISLSAIATNGVVPGGGPYFMYIIGGVEILIFYLAPQTKVFDELHCFRLFGTAFLVLIACVVMSGMRVVNKFALPGVIMVLLCIFLTFVGIFVKFYGSDSLQFCVVNDDRAASLMRCTKDFAEDPSVECTCNETALRKLFCLNETETDCKPSFTLRNAISGLASTSAADNAFAKYLQKDDIVAEGKRHDAHANVHENAANKYFVAADMTTSFIVLIGVFFPSVTGIMAGSNRSGDLKDASRSIPLGTLSATIASSIVYLLGAVLFGASLNELFLRDKFGESANGKLAVAELAWPHPKVIQVGCFLSTLGAGLQSLTGAPRLLCAIAKDGVIPALSVFEKTTRFGEPLRAQLLTFAICELGILIAQLESLTALITQFFLMCYLSTNAACALQSVLKAPSWRPRFHYYHWSMSMFGAALCIAVMFLSHWWFAVIAIAIGVAVYKYIQYRGAEKEWGDGIKGLALSTANFALLNVEEGQPHTKNWRPQLLVLCSTNDALAITHDSKLLAFASQLKAGRGLNVIATVLEGDAASVREDRVAAVRQALCRGRDRFRIKGFTDVLVARDIVEGVSATIQTCGLGGLKPNTVIVSWPQSWRQDNQSQKTKIFAATVRNAAAARRALLAVKNVDLFPASLKARLSGTIDVWWVVHDGGMLLLLAFLLQQNRVWRRCRLRLFTVAQLDENSVKMREELKTFLYQLRIDAEVEIIEMEDSDISEYVYERTMIMEQRCEMLRQLQLSEREKNRVIQNLVDTYHGNRKLSMIAEAEEEEMKRKQSLAAGEAAMTRIREVEEVVSSSSESDEESGGPAARAAPQTLAIPIITIEKAAATNVEESPAHKASPKSATTSANSVAVVAPMMQQPTSPSMLGHGLLPNKPQNKPTEYNVKRMHTAVKLNEQMVRRSADAQLVIVNLPVPPKSAQEDENYMEFVEALTENLKRVLLVRGAGLEVVTIFS